MRYIRWCLVIVFLLLLVLVRYFEQDLFYDPLLGFFKGDFQHSAFPHFSLSKHLTSVSLRYLLNSLLSLGVVYFIFNNKKYVQVSALVLLVCYFILIGLYYFYIATEFRYGFTAGFYIRRLLIQPVLLLLFIPGFWYLNYNKR